MKTTKEQRREAKKLWPGFISDLCDDADEAELLEKENAELRQRLNHHEKAEPEAWHELCAENAELRAKLNEAYERAAQVCEPSIEDWRHAEGDIESINVCQQNSALAKAIRALKEKP